LLGRMKKMSISEFVNVIDSGIKKGRRERKREI
jgi:hypothetical protein